MVKVGKKVSFFEDMVFEVFSEKYFANLIQDLNVLEALKKKKEFTWSSLML